MVRRLKSWLRTSVKLALLVLGYFWLGAAYKLFYAQTHDVSRFKGRIPIPYYQQQFILDALLSQTWIFGPDFRNYIGELPSLGALVNTNTQAALADYCKARETQLTEVVNRYPYSLFAEEALDDAYLYSQGAALLSLIGSRERPRHAFAALNEQHWTVTGLPDDQRALELSRRLADTYPASQQAAAALYRVAQAEANANRQQEALALYRRILAEYPQSEQAEDAAEALFREAREAGRLEQARRYKVQALRAAERNAREKFAGKALPPSATISIMGFRVDLSGVELQLQRVVPAREMADVAEREAARVGAIQALNPELKNDLKQSRERLEEVRNQLWVADLFEAVKVPLPGPAPRAREFPMTGRVLLDGKPLAGVEVIMSERRQGRGMGPRARDRVLEAGSFRARTDRQGRYKITSVPAGVYLPMVAFSVEDAQGRPILPAGVEPLRKADFPERIPVEDKAVEVPDLQLTRALETRTFGELGPVDGKSLRLEWEKWPGAASYAVKVMPVRMMREAFERRVPDEKREEFRRDPVLWSKEAVKGTTVDCPLLNLAPDIPPMALLVQYEYQVTALDAKGEPVAVNSRPLSRFFLSSEARETLLKLKPPVRQGGGPRRRRGRREGR